MFTKDDCEKKQKCWHGGHQASSGLYGLGFPGALIYFMQHADSFTAGLLGFLQALVWPAVLVYEALAYLLK